MNISELNIEIEELQLNVAALVDVVKDLRQKELQLMKEIDELKSENQNNKEQLKFLSEKNKMVSMASSIQPDDRNEMKLKIKGLVREIDGCIAMIKS